MLDVILSPVTFTWNVAFIVFLYGSVVLAVTFTTTVSPKLKFSVGFKYIFTFFIFVSFGIYPAAVLSPAIVSICAVAFVSSSTSQVILFF